MVIEEVYKHSEPSTSVYSFPRNRSIIWREARKKALNCRESLDSSSCFLPVVSVIFFLPSQCDAKIYALFFSLLFIAVEKKRGKRKLDDAMASDSPSNRNTKVARSMSAAPTSTDALHLHAEVAYRLPKQKNAEGEWIQCIIVNVIGENNKRKYVFPWSFIPHKTH